MIIKVLKKPHLIRHNIEQLLGFSEEKKIKKYIKTKKIVWHFATPKSASSFLAKIIIKKLNSVYVNFKNDENNSYQSFNSYRFYNNIKKFDFFFPKNHFFYTGHSHTIFDDYIKKFLSSNHILLIQFRCIYLTIESLLQYLIEDNLVTGQQFFYEINKNLKKNKILDKLISAYTVFHINFLKSWLVSEVPCKRVIIPYKKFTEKPDYFLEKIYFKDSNLFYKFKDDFSDQEKKYKQGHSRKITLSSTNIKRIDNIINSLLSTEEKKIMKGYLYHC